MMAPRSLLVSAVLAFLALFPGPAAGQAPPPSERPIVVRDLAVQGNRRVQEAVLLGRVSTRVGDAFNPSRLADDIRAIFALGFFDDVQLRVEDFEGGVRVVFVVAERPFVRDVVFAGNKKVDTAPLQERVEVKLGAVYNPVDVTRSAERIKEYYEEEGYFEVVVSPDVDKLPDGDVSVVFRIAEGRKITIDHIEIVGAQGLKPKDIKAVMQVQERQFFILRGTVQRQKLDEDLERIVQFYNDYGFVQARVESSDIQVDRTNARAVIRIVVVEGPQFLVGGVDITGVKLLPLEEIRRQVTLKPGEPFSRSKLRETLKQINDLYGAIGRASVEVTPNLVQDIPNRRMNVTLEIVEGPEVYVERINIAGNTRSQEKILRREIPMAEGDLFTNQKLERARQRLINLNYFEKVDATTAPGSAKDRIVVQITVTEKATGLFSIGGGYSSADGLLATLDLSQRNFLGRGWDVTFRIRGGEKVLLGVLSFTEPWLFDRPLAAGLDLFSTRREFDDYTAASVGGDIRVGHPVGDYSRLNAIYRVSRDKISDVVDTASNLLKDEEGTTTTSLVGLVFTRDTRDNLFETTRGSLLSLSGDFAGVGFGNQWFRVQGSASYFRPAWRDHVLSGRVTAGYILGWANDPVPLNDRYFMGGPNSVRSFRPFDISPTDNTGTKIGGNSMFLASIEYTVPLFFGIRVAAFADAGNTWGPDISQGTKFDLTDLKYAVGAGFRWVSPFGPIRVDYGINPARKSGERFGTIQFSVGSAF
jgi:outer membrane protein insertion porin family